MNGSSSIISVRTKVPRPRQFVEGFAVNVLHKNLRIPVTAKFRVLASVEKTIQYAQMMERAGAQILTCHGRTREQRGIASVRFDPKTRGCANCV